MILFIPFISIIKLIWIEHQLNIRYPFCGEGTTQENYRNLFPRAKSNAQSNSFFLYHNSPFSTVGDNQNYSCKAAVPKPCGIEVML
jgi:hypothetical protein